MWKRDTSHHPTSESPSAPESPTLPANMRNESTLDKTMVNIGRSVIIKGELSGSENLTVEGQVEGKIDLKDHILTIGPNGRVRAQIFAKSVVVHGQVVGNITATERVTVRESGSVEGDVQAPRFAIAEGATFRGKVDMQNEHAAATKAGFKAQTEPRAKSAEANPPVSGAAVEA
jgi:cytoskeletal protein CcmA (bactofilin family)